MQQQSLFPFKDTMVWPAFNSLITILFGAAYPYVPSVLAMTCPLYEQTIVILSPEIEPRLPTPPTTVLSFLIIWWTSITPLLKNVKADS